jgi:hypothetical protein
MSSFKFPARSSRVSIIGMTGSGKTRFGAWLFSHWVNKNSISVIIDFKGDDLIAQIDRAIEINLKTLPTKPGLYVLRPRPDQADAVDAWLWRVWEKGNIALFIDEGYMIPKSKALDAILTQGRSLKIPAMVLTQRPVYCSRFVFSQADYVAMFFMNDKRDWETVAAFTPQNGIFAADYDPPEYTCRWYDVARRYSTLIDPVPGDGYILDRFNDRLRNPIRTV